jgi:hypothetical protein
MATMSVVTSVMVDGKDLSEVLKSLQDQLDTQKQESDKLEARYHPPHTLTPPRLREQPEPQKLTCTPLGDMYSFWGSSLGYTRLSPTRVHASVTLHLPRPPQPTIQLTRA